MILLKVFFLFLISQTVFGFPSDQELICCLSLKKLSPDLLYVINEKRLCNLEVFNIDQFSSLESLIPHKELSGRSHRGLYKAEIENEIKIIKMLSMTPGKQEITIYKELSDKKIVPEFVGIGFRADHQNQIGLITNFISDTWVLRDPRTKGGSLAKAVEESLNEAMAYGKSHNLLNQWKKGLKRIFSKLKETGYLMTDPQFLLTKKGTVFLIDVEGYKKVFPKNSSLIKNDQYKKSFLELFP